jgi:hypothetical protein
VALVAFFCLIVGYFLAAVPIVTRAAENDLKALESTLHSSGDNFHKLAASLFLQRPRSLAGASAAGLAAALLINQIAQGRLTRFLEPNGWSHYDVSVFVTITLAWVVAAQSFLLLGNQCRLIRDVGANFVHVDLFDFRPLQPFARVGFRVALFLLIIVALRLLVVAFGEQSYSTDMIIVLTAVGIASSAAAAGALLLPIGGIHRGIREAKEAELNRISEALGGDEEALQDSPIAVARALRGVQLLEYRRQVLDVAEWPFDAPAVIRFILYLAIPPITWIGGALVDRGISAMLD